MVFFVEGVHELELVKDGTMGADTPIRLAVSCVAPLVPPHSMWHLINRAPAVEEAEGGEDMDTQVRMRVPCVHLLPCTWSCAIGSCMVPN